MLALRSSNLKLGSSVFVNIDTEVSTIMTEKRVNRKSPIRMTGNSKEKGFFARE